MRESRAEIRAVLGCVVLQVELESGGFENPRVLGEQAKQNPDQQPLEVVTTNLRPGYLRKNGVPYSARTTVREYYDLSTERNKDVWFTVTTIVEDPEYLTEPFVTSTNFKKQADATGWNPKPCAVR